MLITYTLKQSAGTREDASNARDATRYTNGLIAAVIGKLILFTSVGNGHSGETPEYK